MVCTTPHACPTKVYVQSCKGSQREGSYSLGADVAHAACHTTKMAEMPTPDTSAQAAARGMRDLLPSDAVDSERSTQMRGLADENGPQTGVDTTTLTRDAPTGFEQRKAATPTDDDAVEAQPLPAPLDEIPDTVAPVISETEQLVHSPPPLPEKPCTEEMAAPRDELDVDAGVQQRPALGSDTSSIDSSGSENAPVSVQQTPREMPAPPPPTKSSSYSSKNRDASLRIFFPTEDLALKAILSPPTLRASVSTGNMSRQQETRPSLAESFLEQTSRLFFLRGNNTTAATTNAATTTNVLPETPKESVHVGSQTALSPQAARASTSVALEEDLNKLNNTIVATNPNLPPPPFANMFSCENCHDDIGSLLSQGRHHCRNCGGSFCASCSAKTSIVPYQLYLTKGEQRVCDGCYNRIRDFHAQAQTSNVSWSGLAPPSSDVFAQDFDLADHEVPVTVFSCSYFVDFAPFYGHLFLTREHVCFRGYKTHKIKIPFADIHSLIKPEFYYINALQINTKTTKEKHFFAEFNGLRDLCFLRLDQLIRGFQEGKKKELTESLSPEELKKQSMVRRRSYKIAANHINSSSGSASDDLANLIAKSTSGCAGIDEDEEDDGDARSQVAYSEDRDESMSTASSASDEGSEPFVPLPPDALLAKMTTLLDCELRSDMQNVFELLWSNGMGRTFLTDHMEKTNDIDIDIGDWQEITSENEATVSKGFAISKENDYTHYRSVVSQHPPKTKFPGLPAYAGCTRLQRLRIEKQTTSTGVKAKWTRFVVSDLLRMSRIPFSDYFEIESRWVFTRDGKNYCHVQVGLVVNFLKSTWFKSQIDSSTRSESKEGLELWAKNALVFLQEHAASGKSPETSTLLPVSPKQGEETGEAFGAPRRTSVEATKASETIATSTVESPRARAKTEATFSSHVNTSSVISDSHSAWTLPDLSVQSIVQYATLLLLLYCVVVIRSQQKQLHQLSETTSRLTAQLESSHRNPIAQEACERSVMDGALASIQDYFASQREGNHR